ncbi:SCO family protein [Hydrogenivirga sp.]
MKLPSTGKLLLLSSLPFLVFLLCFFKFPSEREGDFLSKSYEDYRTYAEQAYDPSKVYIPSFKPPEPGTYELPKVKRISDHTLLDHRGKKVSLLKVKDVKIAVVSFIYTNCPDKFGCPLSNFIMSQLYKEVLKDPLLKKKVVLITISFDPERDRPEVLARYREWLGAGEEWLFLTASNEESLKPVLKDFGQRVQKLYREDGRWTGIFRHVLKIYLLDGDNWVRNIYSTGMVNTPLILSDIKTLLQSPDSNHPK